MNTTASRARLSPLSPDIRMLTDAEAERLTKRYPDLPRSLEQCITCRGRGTFRWYEMSRGGRVLDKVVTYDCDCAEQWIAHRYFLHAGVGLAFQRIGWDDVAAESGAVDKVREYLEHAEGFVNAGLGLILHGTVSGTGKTLLAMLLLKHLLADGYDAYATTFAEMVETFRSTWRDKDEQAWFYRRVKNAGILLLDDVGREQKQGRLLSREERLANDPTVGIARDVTATAEFSLEEVIRHRIANSKPTLITTNLDLDMLQSGYGSNVMSLLRERSSTYRFRGMDFRDTQRNRLVAEAMQGLTRPIVVG